MTLWQEHDAYSKIVEILSSVSYNHHFGGRPFLTAYQLAIAFAERYPAAFAALDYPIGGSGTGDGMTLTKYLSNMLSRKIKDQSIANIEGAFLDNLHLNDINFNTPSGLISSTLTQSPYPLSMFRLRQS